MRIGDLNALVAESLSAPLGSINDNTELQSVLSWDSMAHMILVANIEQKYDVLFSGDEIVEMTHVNVIKKLLISKGLDE